MKFADWFEVPKISVKTEFAANVGADVDVLVVKMSLRSGFVKGFLSRSQRCPGSQSQDRICSPLRSGCERFVGRFRIAQGFKAKLNVAANGGAGALGVKIDPREWFWEWDCERFVKVHFRSLKCPLSRV